MKKETIRELKQLINKAYEMGKIRKNISIDEAIWKKLQELAKKENRSASNFIEYLIEKLEKGE